MGSHDRLSGGIPDIFIPLAGIGNGGVRGGRNENSGMTRGGRWGRFAKRRLAGRIPKRRLGTTGGEGCFRPQFIFRRFWGDG